MHKHPHRFLHNPTRHKYKAAKPLAHYYSLAMPWQSAPNAGAGDSIAPLPADAGETADYSGGPFLPPTLSIHDIAQGQLENCYLLSPLAGMIWSRPEWVWTLIQRIKYGVFSARFWKWANTAYAPVVVACDGRLPTFGAARPNGFYVAMLERLYAFFHSPANTYASYTGGGNPGQAFADLGITPVVWSVYMSNIADIIVSAMAEGLPLTITTSATQYSGSPLIAHHVLTIIGLKRAPDPLITCYNPWGFDGMTIPGFPDTNPNDGTVDVPLSLFRAGANLVTVGTKALFAPIAKPTPALGDANDDGAVNFNDMLVVTSHWNEQGGPGDLNKDGIVNFNDQLVVTGHWTPPPGN